MAGELIQFCAINTNAQLLINGRIQSQQQLSDQVKKALTFVSIALRRTYRKIPIYRSWALSLDLGQHRRSSAGNPGDSR